MSLTASSAATARRRESRFPLQLPTLVSGFDQAGRAFIEQALTLDVSTAGARLTGLSSEISLGSILYVKQGDRRARFQVLWVGSAQSGSENQLGLRCVEVGGHTRKRILAIEADPADQALWRSYLETAGYEVVCRADAGKGMQTLQESAFDLLLLNVSGCESANLELIQFVRENSSATRIVLVSNSAGRLPEALLNRTDGFVYKSNSRHDLLAVMEEMIGAGNQMRWPLPRLAPRYALQVPVLFSAKRAGETVPCEAVTTDISELGMGMKFDGAVVAGELLTLQFRLPGSHRDITPQAMVRRRAGSHHGCEFVCIDCAELDEIRLGCRSLPRLSLLQPL